MNTGIWVFVAAVVGAEYFGWPVQAVLIVTVIVLMVVIGNLESEVERAHDLIVDLEEKLEQSGIDVQGE